MESLYGFTVVIGIGIVLNRKSESPLVLHKVGTQLDGCIKQVKRRRLGGTCSSSGTRSGTGTCSRVVMVMRP